ncbi:MAG TPA: RIP metalloprotease RseP [Thermodesulfobacteriota bacterium]|nr:RIP metalloprotease RseP [Thermodesulfobacteriota bacterium]
MTVILAFLFVIGILVFIHELGHFLVAKRCGVRVEKFSLGFGKKVFGVRWGETEYLVSMLPLGGYVKMYGEGGEGDFIVDRVESGSRAEKAGFRSGDRIKGIEGLSLESFSSWREVEADLYKNPDAQYVFSIERDERKLTLKSKIEDLEGIKAFSEKEYPRGFSNQSVLKRLAIVVAGPFMNLLLPFLFFPIIFMIGIGVSAYLEKTPVVGYVEPGSPASEAGFRKGDIIVQVDRKEVMTWRDVNIAFQSNPDALLKVRVKRDEDIKTLRVKAVSSPEGIVAIGLAEPLDARVGSVMPGSPAERAGLKKGDRIVSVNDVKISDWYQMASIIREKANREIPIVIKRGDSQFEIKITPLPLQEAGHGAIGITPYREEIIKKYGFFESIFKGIKEAGEMVYEVTVLLLSFLYKLFTGKISLGTAGKSIAGPLLIAKVSGSAAEGGIASLLQFTSFISINLALINLFPIPMLDGGHVLYLAIESIKRRPLSRRTLEICQRIGFTFLIFIMFLAIYNDISRLKGSIIESLSRLVDAFK